MKQTSVEFLEEKFNNNNAQFINWSEDYFNDAKEIQKQQIIDAYIAGRDNVINKNNIFPIEYYNETFNK